MAPHFDPTALPEQFFVVGAPRCGTTALCQYLGEHPDICFSEPKEPHYFTYLIDASPEVHDDGDSLARQMVLDYYPRFFPHWRGPGEILGDGSVSYLYSPEAIERILSVQPEARLRVCKHSRGWNRHSGTGFAPNTVLRISEGWDLAGKARYPESRWA